MESTPKMSREEFIDPMRKKVEEALGRVADAINDAPPGQIISGSEEQVRDVFADLRQQAFETGLRESSLNTTVLARGVLPPHPPFGHLLPVGEKGMARPAAQGKKPGPL